MIGARDQFDNLTKWDSKVHVEFGDDAKHVVKGLRIVIFHILSGGKMEVKDAL